MGRVVAADDSLQDKLTVLAKAGTFQIGLLIGQSTSEKDIIVHLAPTPVPDEGDLSSEEEEAVPSPRQEFNKPKYPDSIPKVVESTVSQHARQVGCYSQELTSGTVLTKEAIVYFLGADKG